MSIPGISMGISGGGVGAGGSLNPKAAGTAAALTGAAADASWVEVSTNDPKTVIPASVAPTDAAPIRRRRRVSLADRRQLVFLLGLSVLIMVMVAQPSRCHDTVWAVITTRVFSITFGFVPRAFPGDLYEGSMKSLRRCTSSALPLVPVRLNFA